MIGSKPKTEIRNQESEAGSQASDIRYQISEKDVVMAMRLISADSEPTEKFKKHLSEVLDSSLKPEKPSIIDLLMTKHKKLLMFVVPLIFITLVLTGIGGRRVVDEYRKSKDEKEGVKDYWVYQSTGEADDLSSRLNYYKNSIGNLQRQQSAPTAMMESNLGFSAGGAKDINNFRENIKNGYLPLPTDITYEGLFYDYFFETGDQKECNDLFCPSYSFAISPDPFSNVDEYYMTVGLNSGIKESDFQRKKLNLVVVLDISGSMSSPFNQYYYDQFGNYVPVEDSEEETKTKMEVANESIVAMLNHLKSDDRFGMVLFDDNSYLAEPLKSIGDTDVDKLKEHILDITPQGSTNMEAGIRSGTSLFDDYLDVDSNEYENRIIFLTDAMPNTGEYGESELLKLTSSNADNSIFSTFIGVGVDFNTTLIEAIAKIKGANYYSVNSSKEFSKRLDDEFEYMVTPLVFDLRLIFESEGFEIEKVYGSPEADESSGELMKVNTLFPSAATDGETKGGVILLKLKKIGDNNDINLTVSYKNRSGESKSSSTKVNFVDKNGEYYENSGIRKAILLTRYVNLIRDWIYDTTPDASDRLKNYAPCNFEEYGICVPEEPSLSEWERMSNPLTVSNEYESLFREFKTYFEDEMDKLEDENLIREIEILDALIKH